jgi:hypothetical protein
MPFPRRGLRLIVISQASRCPPHGLEEARTPLADRVVRRHDALPTGRADGHHPGGVGRDLTGVTMPSPRDAARFGAGTAPHSTRCGRSTSSPGCRDLTGVTMPSPPQECRRRSRIAEVVISQASRCPPHNHGRRPLEHRAPCRDLTGVTMPSTMPSPHPRNRRQRRLRPKS